MSFSSYACDQTQSEFLGSFSLASDKWAAYSTANPAAIGIVAGLLVQAYKTVLSPFGQAGQAAIQAFVDEARQTYPGTPNP